MNEPEIVKTVIRELGMNLAVAPFELSAENFGAAFTIPDMIAAGRTSVETISALLDAGADLRSLAIRAMESRSNGCVTLLDALWKTRGIGPDALTNPPSQSLARTYVKVLWDETPIIAHSVLKRFVESGILLDDKNVYTLMRCAKTHALQASAVYGIVRRGCVAKMLAVLEGLHPRLGANSSVAVVPIPCIRDIYALVLAMFMHMLGDARRKCYGQVRRKKSP